jgi:hypothetical protein
MRIKTHVRAGCLVSAIPAAIWGGQEEGSEKKLDEHSPRMSSEPRNRHRHT